jgi:transcriptional regulator with XRE-family HTH domain
MNRIKKVRQQKKIRQIDLARNAGVSQPFLSDLENNRRGAKDETMQRIADALGVKVKDLIKEAG